MAFMVMDEQTNPRNSHKLLIFTLLTLKVHTGTCLFDCYGRAVGAYCSCDYIKCLTCNRARLGGSGAK